MISRGEVRILERSYRSSIAQSQARSNGTVPRVSAVTVPLVSKKNQNPIAPSASSEASGVLDSSIQVPEAATEEWKDLFKGKLNAKGTSLSFIAPEIRDGKSIAKLSSVDICEGNKKWGNAIIFYVVGYSPTISAVSKFVVDNWSNIVKPYIFWHDEGYFIINLKSVDDKNAILGSGPHMFFGKPAIVKARSDKFDFHAEILRTIPLWVKIPNLPLNCWGAKTLSRIGSLLGVPICADEGTSRQLRVSFARLLVEVDVTKPLPNSVWVESPSSELIEIKVLFEWTPPFCKKCNKVGHDCAMPQKKKQTGGKTVVQPLVRQVWVPKTTKPAETKAPESVKVNPEAQI
ncbi:uncharacterized protein LOC110701649 [Chenopodium quinoa]|uniref:uncharacterized protein LOC110701649 n=1 Tax=Chenopodium quinoa TaxID=63459 RepID=UPI000B783ABB|nr:uncharacterized protein LOC110701649 [Chenopodium quinoa]